MIIIDIIVFVLSIPIRIAWAIIKGVIFAIMAIFNSTLNLFGRILGAVLMLVGTGLTVFGLLYSVTIVGIPFGIPIAIVGWILKTIGKTIATTNVD